MFCFFFFNDTATTEIYTLSLHDALPICFLGLDQIMDRIADATRFRVETDVAEQFQRARGQIAASRIENRVVIRERHVFEDRKSTRLNSSHSQISYAVFCLNKKKTR